MSPMKAIASVLFALSIAFAFGVSTAGAQVQPARSAYNVVVDSTGPVTTVHLTAGSGWEDVVKMYDGPIVVISCRDENEAACQAATATLTELAASAGDQGWAFVVVTNGLAGTQLETMVTVGDNPVWSATFFAGRTAAQLRTFVETLLKELEPSKAWRQSRCLPPTYTICH